MKLWIRIVLGCVAAGQLCAHENHAPLPTKGVTIAGDTIMLSDNARKAIGLTTSKITFGDIHRTVTVNARVELPWHRQAMITALVPGKIDQLLVRPGEKVAAGQELARVVSVELDALQLELLQAKANLELAQRLVDQRSALDRQGVIPGKSLLEARATLAEQSAALQIARQKLRALGLDGTSLEQIEATGQALPHVAITSPVNGIITHADVRIGQTVSATDHLYHVVDPSQVWIVGDVLESEVHLLAEGQSVEAEFAALPGKVFRGQIDHQRMVIDPRTRTERVVVAVENAENALRPGMFGRVRVSVQVSKEAIVCPVDAVIRSRSGNYLLVQRKPGKYENRRVKLGLVEKDRIEVLEGVFPGDHVVLIGNSLLAALLGNEHKARVGRADDLVVEPTDSQIITVAHGTIELPSNQQVLASSNVVGRVARILCDPSQDVAEGQVLAEIDSLQLRTVQLELLQTLAEKRLVRQSLDRLKDGREQGMVPQRRLWEIESSRQTLQFKAETLQRQLAYYGLEPKSIAKLMVADLSQTESLADLVQTTVVRAPTAGCVVGFHVVPGQVVHPDEPLFEIHDLATVWVKGFVYESDSNRVQLGQSAQVAFAAYPDVQATGKVVRISPLMHESMRVLPVWIEVDNREHLLKSGMFARVTILATAAEAGDVEELARWKTAEEQN